MPACCICQDTVEDLKVQLEQQQAATADAKQQLSDKEAELQQLRGLNSNEVQAWHIKLEELKEVTYETLHPLA